MQKIQIVPCGDMAVNIEFENAISEKIHMQVTKLTRAINKSGIDGIRELIPTYRSIMVCYNPLVIGYDELVYKLMNLTKVLDDKVKHKQKIIEIPVCYGGEFGPDIDTVAKHNNLTQSQVVKIHSAQKYTIYMLGFTPGFPYLGGMSKKISTPRLENPRTKILGGSVGIAGEQTGLYPIDSPGGWQIIGRTPLELYDPMRPNPILLKASYKIKFKPITSDEFAEIEKKIKLNEYDYKLI